jgi:hypothetical protein
MTVVDAELAKLTPTCVRRPGSIVARRLSGRFVVDEWDSTPICAGRGALVRARWSIRLEGEQVAPRSAYAPGAQPPGGPVGVPLAAAVSRSTDRPLRVTDRPPSLGPIAPFTPLARRLGAVPDHPADLRSLLRSGELVGVPLSREVFHPFHVGPVPVAPIAAALAAGAPIIPVAVLGLELGRWWTVRFGRPLATRRRRSDSDPVELAAATRGAAAPRHRQPPLDHLIRLAPANDPRLKDGGWRIPPGGAFRPRRGRVVPVRCAGAPLPWAVMAFATAADALACTTRSSARHGEPLL